PYIGEESYSVTPAASAALTRSRRAVSAPVSSTSNVRQVPIPITGTDTPLFPSGRCSIAIPPRRARGHGAPVARCPYYTRKAISDEWLVTRDQADVRNRGSGSRPR